MKNIFKILPLIFSLLTAPVYSQEVVPGVGFGTQNAWDNPMQNMGENQIYFFFAEISDKERNNLCCQFLIRKIL